MCFTFFGWGFKGLILLDILLLVSIPVADIYYELLYKSIHNPQPCMIKQENTGENHILNFKPCVISQAWNRFVSFAERLHNHLISRDTQVINHVDSVKSVFN